MPRRKLRKRKSAKLRRRESNLKSSKDKRHLVVDQIKRPLTLMSFIQIWTCHLFNLIPIMPDIQNSCSMNLIILIRILKNKRGMKKRMRDMVFTRLNKREPAILRLLTPMSSTKTLLFRLVSPDHMRSIMKVGMLKLRKHLLSLKRKWLMLRSNNSLTQLITRPLILINFMMVLMFKFDQDIILMSSMTELKSMRRPLSKNKRTMRH